MDATVELDTTAFGRFIDTLIEQSDPAQAGPMHDGVLGSMDVYFDAERARFDLYSARGGDWAEHAPMTIRKRGAGAPILIEEGDLRTSMNRDGADHVLEVDSDGITEGTQDPKARFHQDGTDHMPARPILAPPDPEVLSSMATPIAEGVRGVVRQSSSSA